jgi:dihydrofolate reductase
MRKVIFSMSMSLDGFTVEPDGNFDWAAPDEELHRFHNERMRSIDVQIMGRRLYETMLFWETAETDDDPVMREFAEVWQPIPKVVFSTTLSEVEGNARLAQGGPAEVLAGLEGNIGLGGATLAAAFTELGLIDEYELFVNPVLIGAGTPYFAGVGERVDLELVESRAFSGGTLMLRYRRK